MTLCNLIYSLDLHQKVCYTLVSMNCIFFLKLRKQNLYQSGTLQSMGSQRVGYNSVTRHTCMKVTEELRDVEVYLHSICLYVCVCIYIFISSVHSLSHV